MYKKLIIFLLFFIGELSFALSEFDFTKIGNINENIKDITISSNRLYTLVNKELKIYSIKNPSKPFLLSKFNIKRDEESISVYNNYIYLGDGKGSALFLNVRDLYDIYIEFSYTSKNYQNYGVVIKDDIAYEADGKNGINIIDIKDPYNSFVIGSSKKAIDARDVDVKNNFLYVADGGGGLKIFDVSNPKTPSLVRNIPLLGFANSVKVKDNYVFIADEGGLEIFDISNPYAPIKITHNYMNDSKQAKAVDIKDNYLYLVRKNSGMDILKMDIKQYQVSKEDIKPFIQLLYKKILGRDADDSGLNYWILQVQKGRTATSIAKYFFDSPEFKNLSLSNEEFIKRAYSTLLNRDPDPAGIKYWLGQMEEGVSKEQIFYGFAFSKEFQNLAGNTYKILPFNQDDQLKAFVGRFYNFVLERDADESGRGYWINQLKSGKKNAKDIALGFFHSKEFLNKNLPNEDFIKIVYKTILGRDADSNGLSYWVSQLEKGVSRDKIILGFLSSKEFKKIANSYGLKI